MPGTSTIVNAAGAFGYTDLQANAWSLCAEMKVSAAVVAPCVVSVGTDGQVLTCITNGTASLALGVAIESQSTVGKTAQVVVCGVAAAVPAAGAVAAGDLLKRSVTTAGYVSTTATPAAGEVVGIALAASASNTVTMWVFPAKVTT